MHFSPECLALFNNMQRGKANHRFVIFAMNDQGCVDISQLGSATAEFDEFISALPENKPRYALYNVQYNAQDTSSRVLVVRHKLIFVQWIPESSTGKDKMYYAMNAPGVRLAGPSTNTCVQACSIGDLDLETITKAAARFEADKLVA
ncbi:hypothetical protein CAOG_03729 [Capsaspora owczarzaki ATCC 30864]|uniref:ADF-H domain-containing protein n=1 Tax=Capsaspora owczarzaki (strain ATCC 30864) TaxID=595528 RepID=A0A0D2UCQ3_CAPO3|nr:hypothetical protein CAOG_03729 [Capsaspora owczarzaki ATCC 30864]KJE92831.1 hypothetical protein CAOG_003729 [Capsaspora owczarzaki ATCC 30864]|eukprot:XP_004363457.1 hypothetical protein CAOG_03729 [Capsaspora owczarzaki ATCC 30864]